MPLCQRDSHVSAGAAIVVPAGRTHGERGGVPRHQREGRALDPARIPRSRRRVSAREPESGRRIRHPRLAVGRVGVTFAGCSFCLTPLNLARLLAPAHAGETPDRHEGVSNERRTRDGAGSGFLRPWAWWRRRCSGDDAQPPATCAPAVGAGAIKHPGAEQPPASPAPASPVRLRWTPSRVASALCMLAYFTEREDGGEPLLIFVLR